METRRCGLPNTAPTAASNATVNVCAGTRKPTAKSGRTAGADDEADYLLDDGRPGGAAPRRLDCAGSRTDPGLCLRDRYSGGFGAVAGVGQPRGRGDLLLLRIRHRRRLLRSDQDAAHERGLGRLRRWG